MNESRVLQNTNVITLLFSICPSSARHCLFYENVSDVKKFHFLGQICKTEETDEEKRRPKRSGVSNEINLAVDLDAVQNV